MAHAVASMAYVGETPWHGLGNRLADKQPIEVWQDQAGMNWSIESSPVNFMANTRGNLSTIHAFSEQKVLYRSDSKEPLSVVSNRYQVVQPREVLEFYRDLTEVAGYELETAGVLKGGRKFWALAKTGQQTVLKGKDAVNGYLLLATSCDGSLATTATPTTVRVVCNNTLSVSFNEAGLNCRAEFSAFDRSTGRPVCVGNGVKAKRVTDEGLVQLLCPSPQGCAFAQAVGCKPYGRLNVKVEGQEDELGSFIFRTTGFNSIRTLMARLNYFSAVSGNRLAALSLALRLRAKSTTQSFGLPVYYVDCKRPTLPYLI